MREFVIAVGRENKLLEVHLCQANVYWSPVPPDSLD